MSSGGSSASGSAASGSASGSKSGSGSASGDLTKDEKKRFREIFKKIDTAGDGSLDVRDLETAMRSIGASTSGADLQQIIDLADQNQDNKIDFEEFCTIMKIAEKYRYMQIEDAFKEFDKDGNGAIDSKELKQEMEKLGIKINDSKRNKMIKKADKNKDNKIDLHEFAIMMGYTGKQYKEAELQALRDQLDDQSSASGSHSEEEAVETGHITVKHFYTGQKSKINMDLSETVSSFVKKIAEKFEVPEVRVRLYNRGLPLDKTHAKKTLEELDIHSTPGKPVFIAWNTTGGELNSDSLWKDGKPDLEVLKQHFDDEGRLRVDDCVRLISEAQRLFQAESTLVELEGNATIVGDIHGQYFDLARILEAGGKPGHDDDDTAHHYVFLGDYVDRGVFSTEVYLYCLALKLNYPDRVTMLRGNHEAKGQNKKCGSMGEWYFKYDPSIYQYVLDCITAMPLAAKVTTPEGLHFLCSHGGISPNIDDIAKYNDIERAQETPTLEGRQILWDDPYDTDLKRDDEFPLEGQFEELQGSFSGSAESGFGSDQFFPSSRGADFRKYGTAAMLHFLRANDIVCIFRGHELKQPGYQCYKNGPHYKFPGVITVFSAPMYMDDSASNLGAVVVLKDGGYQIKQYQWNLHPRYYSFCHSKASESGPPPAPAGQKNLKEDDLLIWAYELNPSNAYNTPFAKLRDDYAAAFKAAKGGKSEKGDKDINYWDAVAANMTAILKTADNEATRKRWKRKSAAMAKWYTGFNHFDTALAEESQWTVSFEDSDDGKNDDAWTSASKTWRKSANKAQKHIDYVAGRAKDAGAYVTKSLGKGVTKARETWYGKASTPAKGSKGKASAAAKGKGKGKAKSASASASASGSASGSA